MVKLLLSLLLAAVGASANQEKSNPAQTNAPYSVNDAQTIRAEAIDRRQEALDDRDKRSQTLEDDPIIQEKSKTPSTVISKPIATMSTQKDTDHRQKSDSLESKEDKEETTTDNISDTNQKIKHPIVKKTSADTSKEVQSDKTNANTYSRQLIFVK